MNYDYFSFGHLANEGCYNGRVLNHTLRLLERSSFGDEQHLTHDFYKVNNKQCKLFNSRKADCLVLTNDFKLNFCGLNLEIIPSHESAQLVKNMSSQLKIINKIDRDSHVFQVVRVKLYSFVKT